MHNYIGKSVSRIDGHDKVTGAAKYAGEFNESGLAYGSVVTSTIAKGRIARIDASEALRVEGVLAVLTHENRPAMAKADRAYKDDVAPDKGKPFRPLYDDKVWFSGQPIALVLATEWEIARFAASLVRVTYKEKRHATDIFANVSGLSSSRGPRSRAATRRRLMPQPRCATKRSISFRPSTTIRWNFMPPRRSGTAAASSRSMTRPRACRTCSAICTACAR